MQMKVNVSQIRKYRFAVDNGTYSIIVDLPKEMGGSDRGPSSLDVLLMALGGCTGQIFAFIAGQSKVPYSDLEISVEGKKNEQNTLTTAHIKVKVSSSTDEEALNKVLEGTLANCPVGVLLKDKVVITHDLKVIKI